jgi:3-deoxy-D-manno-octulosonic-acid transferase
MKLYDLGVLFGILASLPKILWRKKGRVFWQKLTVKPPSLKGPVIWIHAVSLGEMKSAKGLLGKIRAHYPNTSILVTTGTPAGLDEARRSFSEAQAICFLPFDFSWVMRRWAKALKPSLVLLVESDFWMQHLTYAKKAGAKIVLVSGKISEKSARRFALFPFFSKRLFSLFDHLLVQNEEYRLRFAPFSGRVSIGGNLKLSAKVERKNMPHSGFSIALVSTHAPEEEELLEALKNVEGTIFLAPRHPERFDPVEKILEEKGIAFSRWSQQGLVPGKRVVLVDAMGQLATIYALSDIAIVAGSFASNIGGHNVLEPCLYGLPVFFGPSIHGQKELAATVQQAGAGKQVAADALEKEIRLFCADPLPLRQGVETLSGQLGRSLEETWQEVFSLLENQKAWE